MHAQRLTVAEIHLDRLLANLRYLRERAGSAEVWPVVKANAYGHGVLPVARALVDAGSAKLCVADVSEAVALREGGIGVPVLTLSPALPEHAEALVAHGCEALVSGGAMAATLDAEARRQGRRAAVHLMVDTGMARSGVLPSAFPELLEQCQAAPGLEVRGVASHFARADEADKSSAQEQLARFRSVMDVSQAHGSLCHHIANSAALLELPESTFDAVRPGIALYGLRPSAEIRAAHAAPLQPVLEWHASIVQLKEVPAGTGLSYGHTFRTERESLIATVPVGYADGLRRGLSNRMHMLVRGRLCPQVGRITMDLSLLDVTALRGQVCCGDRVTLLGNQGEGAITADDWATALDTINYEIVSAIAHRVPRVFTGVSRPDAEKPNAQHAHADREA